MEMMYVTAILGHVFERWCCSQTTLGNVEKGNATDKYFGKTFFYYDHLRTEVNKAFETAGTGKLLSFDDSLAERLRNMCVARLDASLEYIFIRTFCDVRELSHVQAKGDQALPVGQRSAAAAAPFESPEKFAIPI
ncbi:hypothetical protein Tco_0833444 [Tanacetum coccineum]